MCELEQAVAVLSSQVLSESVSGASAATAPTKRKPRFSFVEFGSTYISCTLNTTLGLLAKAALKWPGSRREVKNRHERRENKGGGKKAFWQLTHYLCRYPPVASSSPPLSLSLSLSICQWRDKIPLSWRLSRDYPGVPGEGGRGAEMPHYRCSKGYSKFNGPEVEQEEERSQ